LILAVALIALGFMVRGVLPSGKASHPQLLLPPLDHFLWWSSFSEVDQTRGLLQALCLRSIAEARRKYLESRPTTGLDSPPRAGFSDATLSNAVEEIRRRMDEFQGTEQELVLGGELLRLLRRCGRDSEWLDVYLRMLYQHPNRDIVDWLRSRAIEVGEMTGRINEVRGALHHRGGIPSEYRGPLNGRPESNPVQLELQTLSSAEP
jgi:hypothetical protein